MKKLRLFVLSMVAVSSAICLGMVEVDISEHARQEQVTQFLKFVMERTIQYPVQKKEVGQYLQQRINLANAIFSSEASKDKEENEYYNKLNPHGLTPRQCKLDQHVNGWSRMVYQFAKTVDGNWKALLTQKKDDDFHQKEQEKFVILLIQSKKFAHVILNRLQAPKANL